MKKNCSRAIKTSFVLSHAQCYATYTHLNLCRDYRFSISLMKLFYNFTQIYIFPVCWVPFFCVNIVAAFCKTCIGGQTFKILSWLGYSNSAFNPIIYSIFNTEFREAFKRILTTKAALCCAVDEMNYHCNRNSERFVTDYQSTKCTHLHSGRSSADLEQVSAI